MTLPEFALTVALALVLWIAIVLLVGCTVAAVSVDCPAATDATGEAGARTDQ
jgi:hypothetical protein